MRHEHTLEIDTYEHSCSPYLFIYLKGSLYTKNILLARYYICINKPNLKFYSTVEKYHYSSTYSLSHHFHLKSH